MDIETIKGFLSKAIEDMPLFLSFCTFVFTAITLLYSYKFAKDSNKISVVAQKRSKRIDEMRQSSSKIISNAECIIRKLDEKNNAKYKASLVFEVNYYVSLLQYVYEKDIELIDMAKSIAESLCNNQNKMDEEELLNLIRRFWYRTDLYIGTEFERLKKEASGKVEKSGGVEDSSLTFSGIYTRLEKESQRVKNLQNNPVDI